ncbi:MAG: hypothetical protein HC915_02330 [Anaerolineae bacterium]|nr:hypothetical protein [Anaerolineae bacterium]
MRKLLIFLLVFSLVLPLVGQVVTVYAQDPPELPGNAPARVLPGDTLFYFEIAGATLPDQLDTLLTLLLPEQAATPSVQPFLRTPILRPGLGSGWLLARSRRVGGVAA